MDSNLHKHSTFTHSCVYRPRLAKGRGRDRDTPPRRLHLRRPEVLDQKLSRLISDEEEEEIDYQEEDEEELFRTEKANDLDAMEKELDRFRSLSDFYDSIPGARVASGSAGNSD